VSAGGGKGAKRSFSLMFYVTSEVFVMDGDGFSLCICAREGVGIGESLTAWSLGETVIQIGFLNVHFRSLGTCSNTIRLRDLCLP